MTMLRSKAKTYLFLFLAGLLGACSTSDPPSSFEELGERGNTRGFGREYPQDPNENAFVFGVGDELLLTVQTGDLASPELSGSHLIRQDGNVTLPLLNEVAAAGLTSRQIAKKLESRYALFVVEPRVVVSPGLIVSKRFFVGAINPMTGGTALQAVPYRGDQTLFDVFVEMGAPSTILDDSAHVKVIRGDPRNPDVKIVNVRQIWLEGRTGGNIQIRPDDIVYVPPTVLGQFNAFVAGISIPFANLFRISSAVVNLDYSVRVITGDVNFNRGRAFY
jgi:polysaccharide export outer membrane protein